jgi:RimJ/RimL family protein N-acetyltransferase
MSTIISLLPLDAAYHTAALQGVYGATPAYWGLYNLPGSPPDQAGKDLVAAGATPGRFLLGIVKRVDPANPAAGAELIGVIDFRLQWPAADTAYIGMLMVAEPYQHCGVGTQAWSLLKPWLASTAHITTARVGVEQFNIAGLKFWQHQGFAVTGESDRVHVGEKSVRLLYLAQVLAV